MLAATIWRRSEDRWQVFILNGESYEVIGVAPRDFALPNPQAELAIPLAPDVDPLRNERSSVNFLRLIGRLKNGVTIRQAEADLAGIVTRQRQQFGDAYLKKTGINLVSLHEEIVGATRTKLWVLFGAVSLVLLIGCCNLAALSLTRASARSQEIAIRKALGATSGRLISQLLAESLILASIGGVGGLLLATLGVRALLFFSPAQMPRYQGDWDRSARVRVCDRRIDLVCRHLWNFTCMAGRES